MGRFVVAVSYSTEPNKYLRSLIGLALVIILVGGLPIFATRIAGIHFLPTASWVGRIWLIAWSVGIFCTIMIIIAYTRMLFRLNREPVGFKHLIILLFAPLLGIIGAEALISGGPLVYTALIGHTAENRFIIARAGGSSSRKCPNRIELKDMPFLHNELCGFSKEFLDSLRPGKTIIISGRSSSVGTFVSSARVE